MLRRLDKLKCSPVYLRIPYQWHLNTKTQNRISNLSKMLSTQPVPKCDPNFGRVVENIDPSRLSDSQFEEINELLHKHSFLLFKDVNLIPEDQDKLTRAFDPFAKSYGHGNNKTSQESKSILHPDLKTIPHIPTVQVIGNGTIYDHEGLAEAKLKHPHHKTFHKTRVTDEDEKKGITRFYRWHIDAALYDLDPPKVTTLYALKVPKGPKQTLRYDDGTGNELEVPLGSTAFVSGKNMFDILPNNYKSLAVRMKVVYAPHPYIWMSQAKARPNALGLESDGLELSKDEMPEIDESKVKTYPVLWKNKVTEELHFQVHPSAIAELKIEPLPEDKRQKDSLFVEGAHLTDLAEVRDLMYRMQRPAISPQFVYAHDWQEKDLILFQNRQVLHSVLGAFEEGAVRVFHQCNLAASENEKIEGPNDADKLKYL